MTNKMGQDRKVVLSAVQPTNKITIGNYLGAIKNWIPYQDLYQCYFFAVDLHAITSRQDPKELANNTLFALATYLAAGIDLDHSVIFAQSHVRQHAELAWVLNCYSYTGGFTVAALSGGAAHVTSIDSSGPAIERAVANVALNGFDASRTTMM
ncbi:MAG: class I SAM-dependent methyltransferase, partial [Proteobacteria bacterium]|nr:class I SAM-dependent methyltransferase [Pseudomonadota bacterium]